MICLGSVPISTPWPYTTTSRPTLSPRATKLGTAARLLPISLRGQGKRNQLCYASNAHGNVQVVLPKFAFRRSTRIHVFVLSRSYSILLMEQPPSFCCHQCRCVQCCLWVHVGAAAPLLLPPEWTGAAAHCQQLHPPHCSVSFFRPPTLKGGRLSRKLAITTTVAMSPNAQKLSRSCCHRLYVTLLWESCGIASQ